MGVPSSLRLRALPLLLLLLAASAPAARAQTATVRGFVTDRSDGQALQGVNVILRQGETILGTATDGDGAFIIPRVPPGRYALTASFVGYATHADTLDLRAGRFETLRIALAPEETEFGEVVVETEREQGAGATVAGLQTIRPGDIERVPTADISADLVSYLTTLPGVVSTGDRGGQFFVRGGTADQNLVLLDGMVVYQPFHIVGFFSAFPADILQRADVYAGGFGARYGGRLSSVLDVASRNGNKQRFAGSASLAPFLSTLQVEGPLLKGRVSVLGSLRESVVDRVSPVLFDRPFRYRFGDRFGKIHAALGRNSQLSVTALSTHDRGTIDDAGEQTGGEEAPPDGSGDDRVNWRNEAYGVRYLLLPANLPVLAEVLLSTSRIENSFGPPEAPERTASVRNVNASTHLTHYLGALDVTWGLFVRSVSLAYDLGGQFQGVASGREYLTEAGAFLETELGLARGLRVSPGLRFHSYPSLGSNAVEPRLKAVWQPGGERGRHRLSAAWGVYHQEVVGLNDRRDAGDVFTAWAPSPVGAVPSATHYIAGWNVRPLEGVEISAEGFYKTVRDLAISEWTAFPRFTTRLQPADGRVRGVDLRVELTRSRFYGYVSYGLSHVEYNARQQALVIWYGDEQKPFSPPHDRRHQLNALGQLTLGDFSFSVRWQFGSGLPYSQSIGFDRWIMMDSTRAVTQLPGQPRVLYGEPYGGRLPTYHRLDVSAEQRFTPARNLAVTIQAGLINAYNRPNLFYLNLFNLHRVDQMPIIPTVGLKIEVL